LYALVSAIVDIDQFGFFGIAGTTFTLRNVQTLQSEGGRSMAIYTFTKFIYYTEQQAMDFLCQHFKIDVMTRMQLTNGNIVKLEGRPRLVTNTIIFLQYPSNKISELELIESAIEQSFNLHLKSILDVVLERISNEEYDKLFTQALTKMAVAVAFDERIVFDQESSSKKAQQRGYKTIDFIHAGICHPRQISQTDRACYCIMDEPLSRAIVVKVLTEIGTATQKVVTAIETDLLGRSAGSVSAQKQGLVVEKLIANALTEPAAMKHFISNMYMPRQKRTSLEWATNMKFEHIKTKHDDNNADLEFLANAEKASGKLLLPNNLMGHDIVGTYVKTAVLPKEEDNVEAYDEEDQIYRITIAVKTTDAAKVTNEETIKNYSQLNPRHAYFKDRTSSPTVYNEEMHNRFLEIYEKVDKNLLISVCLPAHGEGNAPQLADKETLLKVNCNNIEHIIRDKQILGAIHSIYSDDHQLPFIALSLHDNEPPNKRRRGKCLLG
jgi:hypothetical protein